MKRISICFIACFFIFSVFGCGCDKNSSNPAPAPAAEITSNDNSSPDGQKGTTSPDDETEPPTPNDGNGSDEEEDDDDDTGSLDICFFNPSLPYCISMGELNYDPVGPIPEEKKLPADMDWTEMIVDETVVVEMIEIYSPLSIDNGEPPPECDYIRFLRFRLHDNSRTYNDAQDADAVLLMIPGMLGGANSFEYIGRQVVYAAKENHGLEFEVWAMDRRNNCLEDTYIADLIEEGLKHGTIGADEAVQMANDYYYYGKEVGGQIFQYWRKSSDTPYLSEFGLEMDTKDMFKIAETMLPNRQVRKQKLFVGGHAMGGIHTSLFAGWDLDGKSDTLEDAGYNNCAGLFGFDTFIKPIEEMLDDYVQTSIGFVPEFFVSMGKDFSELVYVRAMRSIRNGSGLISIPRILSTMSTTGANINAEFMAIMEIAGLLAYYAPDEEHTAIKELNLSNNFRTLLRTYQSRNDNHETNHIPSINDFRYTNEALLGILFDDDFTHINFFQASMGFLNGGAVTEKKLHEYKDMELFVAIDAGPDFDQLGEGPLYTWTNYDEVGKVPGEEHQDIDSTTTFTTMDDEVSNIRNFARAMFKGPLNSTEWYFPSRRILDIVAAACDYGPEYGINNIHSSHMEDLPKIEFIAEDGVTDPSQRQYTGYPITGFNHLDPLFQAANTSSHRANDVIIPLIEFVENIINTNN